MPVLIGTLGKAFGSFGAFVAGPAELIEYLMQKARSYIYTTALPQPVAAASRAALALVRAEGWRRAAPAGARRALPRRRTRRGTAAHWTRTRRSSRCCSAARRAALQMQGALAAAGLCVVAIRPPTVPPAAARGCAWRSRRRTREPQVDELVSAAGARLGAAAPLGDERAAP